MFRHACRTRLWSSARCRVSLILVAVLTSWPVFAQISVNGVTDRGVYTDNATLIVVTEAGYGFSATLNNRPLAVGTAVTVNQMDYYDLVAWRTNLVAPFEVTNVLVRFIIVASDRGSPEQGLIKWTPHPLINSTAAEWAGARLGIMTPQDYPAGLPIPVIARAEDAQGNERRANGFVTAPGFEANPVKLLRGHGSDFLPAAASGGPISYQAQLFSMQAHKQINIDTNTDWTEVSGILATSVAWPENSRIHLTGHLAVPAGVTLTVGAGTIVKLDPLVNVTNTGQVILNGTTDRPVVFTSTKVVFPEKNAGAWGGFLLRGASAQLIANGTIFAGGGGAPSFDFSPGSSHKSQQAVLLIHSGAKANLTNCAIINTAGQIHNGYASDITYDHCLAQRAITGGECAGGGTVIINHSAFIEFPADDGVVNATITDADYDALYFTEGTHQILNSLVGFAKDDALDSGSGGGGTMLVTNCWIESALHEANAWSGQSRQCWTYDSVLMNCGQGLENGWSTGTDSPLCHAERILATANAVGMRIGDNYNWSYNGFLKVTNSLILNNYRDLFLKTWNSPTAGGWDTNSWVDRVGQCHFGANLITTSDPRFPSNLLYDPARDGAQLAHWMSTPASAPVGIGLAIRTNRISLAQLTNGIPVRLSSFTTNQVSVDYAVLGTNGPIASGTLQFAPGETLKNLSATGSIPDQPLLEIVLKNPVRGELTSLSQAWYFAPSASNPDAIPFVAPGSRWNYLDTGGDAGTAWRDFAYDDRGWSNGPAQLGFGDEDENTPIRQVGTNGQNSITFYFRQAFKVSDADLAAYNGLDMWLLRDDGAVVYLNGTEVFRSDSLPPSPTVITHQTLATNYNGGGAPPDNTVDTASWNTNLLVSGTNMVAVEVHQQAAGSSDVSFDFALTGRVALVSSPPVIQRSPTNQTVPLGGTAVFCVEATGDVPMGYQWWRNQTQLLDWTIGPMLTVTNVGPADAGTYQAVAVNPTGSAASRVATLTITSADADGDGMADNWELDHGLIVGVDDAGLDPDNDRMTNLEEFIAGTDPQDNSSYLKIVSVTAPGVTGTAAVISFAGVAGHSYAIQFTETLSPVEWNSLTNLPPAPSDQAITVFDAGATNRVRRYYRLQTPAPF